MESQCTEKSCFLLERSLSSTPKEQKILQLTQLLEAVDKVTRLQGAIYRERQLPRNNNYIELMSNSKYDIGAECYLTTNHEPCYNVRLTSYPSLYQSAIHGVLLGALQRKTKISFSKAG